MIIGITGTIGAGKGTVAAYVVRNHGFNYFSARDVWNEEIARRGLPSNRDTMTSVANDMRARYGSHYFSELALAHANALGGHSVFESIRTVGEAQYLKSHGAFLWAVDADVHRRYERIVLRKSETDNISFEKFVADEEREMASTDQRRQNLAAVRRMADTILTNDGTPEELYQQVEVALQKAGYNEG